MKIVNGKLLGEPDNKLDIFQEQIEHRCDRLENSLSNEQHLQIETYKQGLEKIFYWQQVLGKKIQLVENNQLTSFEPTLALIKQYIPIKLIWLTFLSSLTIGLISMFSLIKVTPQNQCQPTSEPIKISILLDENLDKN